MTTAGQREHKAAGAAHWIVGGATAIIGLTVLLVGLLPPNLMATGQVDPKAWAFPASCGACALGLIFRWAVAGRQVRGGWVLATVPALLTLVMPPVILCFAVSGGQAGRVAIWSSPVLATVSVEGAQRAALPTLGIMSGPELHTPAMPKGGGVAGFVEAPLWRMLEALFVCVPIAALDDASLAHLSTLLLIQPRALGPEELVALDGWVRRGGRVVILTDPDLLWHDERPLGHSLRAPPSGMLDPLLRHWGLTLAPAPPRSSGDPVVRRFLDDGRMLQIAGASHFIPNREARCSLSSHGLVARCAPGQGIAILVADADFANDALWTTDGATPGRFAAWTSDTVPVLADWLAPGAGGVMGRRIWMERADGLSVAVRFALLALVLGVGFTVTALRWGRTKQEL